MIDRAEAKSLEDKLSKEAIDAICLKASNEVEKWHQLRNQHLEEKLQVYLNEPIPSDAPAWNQAQWQMAHFLEHELTRNFIIFIIVLNAIFLGIQGDQGNEQEEV